jgi:hypothetical protein
VSGSLLPPDPRFIVIEPDVEVPQGQYRRIVLERPAHPVIECNCPNPECPGFRRL